MNVATEQESYLEAVRRALGDLDPATRDELLEDLPEHLAEVAAEGEGPLTERLGPPEAYATELRAAAGIAEPVSSARGLDDRVATAMRRVRGTLGAADRKAGPLFGYGRASEFLRMLLPAWWVLRGYLVAMLITVITTGAPFGLLPRLGGSTLAAILLLAVCVLASIWLGRREGGLPPLPKAGVVVAGMLLFIFGLVGFSDADDYGRPGWTLNEPQSVSNNPYESVQDIYVYDENGHLVRNVRLYDQDGQPIRIGDPYRCQQSYEYSSNPDIPGPPYPYCPDRPPYETAPVPVVVGRAPVTYAPTPEELMPTTVDPSPTPTAVPTETPAPTPNPSEPTATPRS